MSRLEPKCMELVGDDRFNTMCMFREAITKYGILVKNFDGNTFPVHEQSICFVPVDQKVMVRVGGVDIFYIHLTDIEQFALMGIFSETKSRFIIEEQRKFLRMIYEQKLGGVS